ncbi:MAG TPA: hypothetical protein VHT52_22335 [Stellaceae bacterium]|jgi:hypothetical protein|nr:hypothetical protein [Stellaceae bacterium]
MIHQLRIYEIFEDTKNAFHARFRDHAARIMRRYETGALVGEIEDRLLVPTNYSRRSQFQVASLRGAK